MPDSEANRGTNIPRSGNAAVAAAPAEAGQPTSVGEESKKRISDAFFQISLALRGLSNREARIALKASGAEYDVRFVPMATMPAGTVPAVIPTRPVSGQARGTRGSAPVRAAWKTDPRWITYQEAHNRKVAEIKAAPADARATLVTQLHEMEVSGKELKRELQSFRMA